MPRPTRGCYQNQVRPASLESGGQNWRTGPRLASHHLNEHSAPGDTGSPRSIFGGGSRNPEDRQGRWRREETDKTWKERERKRLIKEVEAGTAQHSTTLLGSQAWGMQKRKVGKGVPPSQWPGFCSNPVSSSLLQTCCHQVPEH